MSKDPTLEYKDKLVKLLERLLEEKIISVQHYKLVPKSQDENVLYSHDTQTS